MGVIKSDFLVRKRFVFFCFVSLTWAHCYKSLSFTYWDYVQWYVFMVWPIFWIYFASFKGLLPLTVRVGSISPSKRAGTGSLGYWRIIGSNGILSLPEICALLQTIGASCFWPAYGLSGKKRTKQCSIQNRFRLLKLLTKLPYWLLIWNYMTAVNSRWCKPIPSYYKLNVDGSFGDGSTAFGGVLRDEQGNWVWGFADNSNMQSVLAAELLALRTGLQLLLDEGCVLL